MIITLLLFALYNTKANFLVYYDKNIFVNNTNTCVGEFVITYNSDKTFTSDIMLINFDGSEANLRINSDADVYTFLYGKNDHDTNYIYDIFSPINIYKNGIFIAKASIIGGNNIRIITLEGVVLYYINQFPFSQNCSLPNVYSYFGQMVYNNIVIPENIMAVSIGVILPELWISAPGKMDPATLLLIIMMSSIGFCGCFCFIVEKMCEYNYRRNISLYTQF